MSDTMQPGVPANANSPSPAATAPPSWLYGNGPVVLYVLLVVAVIGGVSFFLARGVQRASKEISKINFTDISGGNGRDSGGATGRANAAIDPAAQGEAEKLLAQVATGDAAAPAQVLAESEGWTGKTHRTPRTDQLVTGILNGTSEPAREAGVQVQLALDGVPRTESSVAMLERAVGDPGQRTWALWMLGALGNRGVDPVHTAKIIESYLDDPNVQVRATSVDALSLVGTDETIPMLLDRFRDDPSPIVQERAACDLAQSGMYTHSQRLTAAASLVKWLDDPQLPAQQRAWTLQALSDISGKNLGNDSAAWKSWLDTAQ
jgi:HEAT repeat protein